MAKRICTIEGCGKAVCAWGWCQMHYMRWKRRGDVGPAESSIRTTCAVKGCERPHAAMGFCSLHYSRMLTRGTTDPPPRRTVEERFWAKVDKTETCWLWTGGTKGKGPALAYGVFMLKKYQPVIAHRFAYELLVGPIPAGLELDHLCRVPACVRPDHLEPVTHAENTRRSTSPIPANALKTHCPKGHLYEGNTYLAKRKSGGVGRICATCQKARSRETARRAKANKRT